MAPSTSRRTAQPARRAARASPRSSSCRSATARSRCRSLPGSSGSAPSTLGERPGARRDVRAAGHRADAHLRADERRELRPRRVLHAGRLCDVRRPDAGRSELLRRARSGHRLWPRRRCGHGIPPRSPAAARVHRHRHAGHDRRLDRHAEQRAPGVGRRGEVDPASVLDHAADARRRLTGAVAAVRARRGPRAHRRRPPADPSHPSRARDAGHVPGCRHGGAHGGADPAHLHGHVCDRLGARGRGGRAARPHLHRLSVDGGPCLAQGVLRGDPRRPRQHRRCYGRWTRARGRRRAGRGLRLIRVSRRRGVRDHHRRPAPASFWPDRPRRTRRMRRAAGLLLALAALTLPLWIANAYFLHVVIMAGIFGVLASSLNLLLGYTGQLSLGHAAFFGIGAYASALLTLRWEWSFWLALPAAVLAAGIAGWAIGRLALKLRGAYFVLVTISFAGVIALISINWMDLTNGPLGLPGVPAPELGPWSLRTKSAYYYLLLAAVVSAGLAGLAGSLYAHYTRFVSPEVFLFTYTVTMVIMVVAGGKGTLAGPLVGAVLFTVLPEALRAATSWQWQMLAYGLILVVLVFFLPRGIVPTFFR